MSYAEISAEQEAVRAELDEDARVASRRQIAADAIRTFIQGGNAYFTIVSKKTGARFTYRASRPDPLPGRRRPIWFSVLAGADNTKDYAFIGSAWPDAGSLSYFPSPKSRVSSDAPSARALGWFLRMLDRDEDAALDQVEVWHEGRCCRCGRRLTDPVSIEAGIGPDCAGRAS